VKSFANFFVLSSALASLALIPSATEAQTSASSEDTALRPESVVSGYPVAPTYTLLRYDEDYSFLANPANRTEPLDVIKYIPLFNLGPSYFVTLGGDIREQYEFIQNDNFGLGSVNNHGYWLQRLMPYSDWHFGPFFRAFVQLKSSEEEGREPGPRPIDRKRLDFGPTAKLNNISLDLFYIGFQHVGARFNAGVGDEVRHSIGGRLWRAHHINGLDFNLFSVYQFGSFGGKSISAFSAAFDAGYKLFNLPWAPRIAGSLQISSGDSSLNGSRLETFNAMFPAGYYYGGALVGQTGPANAIILQPELDLHPTAMLGLYLKTFFFWRQDTADGLYNTPGGLILSGSTSSRRYVGASPAGAHYPAIRKTPDNLFKLLPFLSRRISD
jgi:hypothetical protein